MDTGLDAIIKVYTQEALEETAKEVSLSLEENIKNELYPGHGYDTGELHDSIIANIQTITDTYAIVVGTYDAPHGEYVLAGIRGKGRVEPIDFLGDGLEKTLAMYR
jgi:hypothetical protein